MGFTIITTVSPDFAHLERQFMPTWYANSGATEIVVRHLDDGPWDRNISQRAGILSNELLSRVAREERVLLLDADCLVLRDLSGGFSDRHAISVARWPNPNMGVACFNLGISFPWRTWLPEVAREIHNLPAREGSAQKVFDQTVWTPKLRGMSKYVYRLQESIWNYNSTDLDQWRDELPQMRNAVRVLHFKGHGEWQKYQFPERLAAAKALWPDLLACMGDPT